MAGVFEQINSRHDFRSEVERAQKLCAHFLPLQGNDPVLISVAKQLDFIHQVLSDGREPTRQERKSFTMGFIMTRRWEEIHDDMPFHEFKNLILLLDMYFRFWPSDKLASDPKNDRKIDWDGDYYYT